MKFINVLLFVIQIVFTLGKKKEINKTILKEEVPHIGCDVCTRSISEIYSVTNDMRDKAPYEKLEEIEIINTIENVCIAESKSGEWIRKLDISEVKENGRKFLKVRKLSYSTLCIISQ